MYRQSEDVRTGVLNALYWDLRVPRHQVRVEIENGVTNLIRLQDADTPIRGRRKPSLNLTAPDPSAVAAQTDFNMPPST